MYSSAREQQRASKRSSERQRATERVSGRQGYGRASERRGYDRSGAAADSGTADLQSIVLHGSEAQEREEEEERQWREAQQGQQRPGSRRYWGDDEEDRQQQQQQHYQYPQYQNGAHRHTPGVDSSSPADDFNMPVTLHRPPPAPPRPQPGEYNLWLDTEQGTGSRAHAAASGYEPRHRSPPAPPPRANPPGARNGSGDGSGDNGGSAWQWPRGAARDSPRFGQYYDDELPGSGDRYEAEPLGIAREPSDERYERFQMDAVSPRDNERQPPPHTAAALFELANAQRIFRERQRQLANQRPVGRLIRPSRFEEA
jgi:hypothetical protein